MIGPRMFVSGLGIRITRSTASEGHANKLGPDRKVSEKRAYQDWAVKVLNDEFSICLQFVQQQWSLRQASELWRPARLLRSADPGSEYFRCEHKTLAISPRRPGSISAWPLPSPIPTRARQSSRSTSILEVDSIDRSHPSFSFPKPRRKVENRAPWPRPRNTCLHCRRAEASPGA